VQNWWIALSGNLVSIGLGLVTLPLIRYPKKPIVREILHSFSKVELGFALVVYPIWSFAELGGDWATIYDFSITPYAQLTLAVHLLLLLGLSQLERSGLIRHWLLQAKATAPVADADPTESEEATREEGEP
jgi:hypothetical protein